MRIAGIMSGTSLDGIDVAVVDIRDRGLPDVAAHRTFAYPSTLREQLLQVSNATVHVSQISRLNFRLAELYAGAIKKCGVPPHSIELIGCHGQTVFHERGSTLQLGDGTVLAQKTGIPVVSNFRPGDMAAGGRGAPLVPYADFLLFGGSGTGRVALNIGGIANVTIMPANAGAEDVIAFDTGPGNMVVDQLIAIHTRGRRRFDDRGVLAARGRVDSDLLQQLLRNPFYRLKPPKTAGREQYGREFVDLLLKTRLPMQDLVATATALTAASIAAGLERFGHPSLKEIVVAGGGFRNRTLMGYLAAFLPRLKVRSSAEFGIDTDAKEAIAFAMLAHETWRRRPSNLPSATGARRPVILGEISYAG